MNLCIYLQTFHTKGKFLCVSGQRTCYYTSAICSYSVHFRIHQVLHLYDLGVPEQALGIIPLYYTLVMGLIIHVHV